MRKSGQLAVELWQAHCGSRRALTMAVLCLLRALSHRARFCTLRKQKTSLAERNIAVAPQPRFGRCQLRR